MRFKPHDYQRKAINFIYDHPEVALLLDMGLGKTVITLTAVNDLLYDFFDVSRVLVVAPLRVARDTWPAEATKWEHLADLRLAACVGTPAQRKAALDSHAPVTVINRENLPWLVKHLGRKWDFDMVVLDESSSFKNHRSQRFRAMRAVRPAVKRVVALTGTPASNGLLDLFAQFRLIDQGERLGKYVTHYRDELFEPDKRNATQVFSWKPKPGAEEEIYQRIGDITLSMRAADHLTLPDRIVVDVPVALSDVERAKYDELQRDLVLTLPRGEGEGEGAGVGGVVDAANAAVLAAKLQQMASGAVYTEDEDGAHGVFELHSRKLDALEDLVEAANGQNLLVAYWFKSDLERILRRFPQARELRSAADMEAWTAGEVPLGLIHPASAGHGLNLQAGGHQLVWFTPIWDLELYAQTNARLHRQGQEHSVTIHRIVAADTIDQRILSVLGRKDVTQAALVAAVRAELHELGVSAG